MSPLKTIVSKFYQWFFLFLIALVLFSPSLIYPYLDIDELIWGEFANSVLRGCPPYVCVLGEKPPLIYLFYTGIFFVFGRNNYFILHLIHIIWVSFTALLLNQVFLQYSQRENLPSRCIQVFNFLPGFFYLILMGLPGFRMLAATGESLMNFFLIFSWLLLVKTASLDSNIQNRSGNFSGQKTNFGKMFLIGGMIGFATLFRHQATIQIFAYGGFLIFSKLEKKYRSLSFGRMIQRFVGIVAGLSFIWLCTYLLLVKWGAWDAFVQWGILHNFSYVANGAKAPGVWKSTLENGLQLFGSTLVFWILGVVGICHLRKSASKTFLNMTLFYLFAAFIASMTGFRFYPHYFIQCFPPLAILATAGFYHLSQASSPKIFYKLSKIGLVLSFFAIILQNLLLPFIFKTEDGKDYAFASLKKIGEYIRERTTEKETIFVWGWGEGIHYYSDRGMGTRFIISDFLSGRVPASDARSYTPRIAQQFVESRYWKMFIEDMEKNRPTYVVDTSPAEMHDYQYFPIRSYPVLQSYLEKHYHFEATVEGTNLFRKNDNL